jgi:hypothetical protein
MKMEKFLCITEEDKRDFGIEYKRQLRCKSMDVGNILSDRNSRLLDSHLGVIERVAEIGWTPVTHKILGLEKFRVIAENLRRCKQRALREETLQGNTQSERKCRLSGVFSG